MKGGGACASAEAVLPFGLMMRGDTFLLSVCGGIGLAAI